MNRESRSTAAGAAPAPTWRTWRGRPERSRVPRELEEAATRCVQAEWHLSGIPRSAFQVDTDEVVARSRALAALAEVRRSPVSPGATACLLYTSPSPRDGLLSRMPSSA